ncbi:hypothetical protein EON64_16075, partial [archaeon]
MDDEEELNTTADSNSLGTATVCTSGASSAPDADSESQHTLYHRRGQVNYDNFIDAVLAGREKKFSVEVPSASHCRLHHPRRVFLADEQYASLLSEVNGQKYGKGDRPELEIVVVVAERG